MRKFYRLPRNGYKNNVVFVPFRGFGGRAIFISKGR